ncbi:MAG: Nif3-like dinuclear metal center hexameric protein [Eubacteriales bacterium]
MMNTKEIMDLALELAGLDEVPADSAIIVDGENIKKVLVGVDMGTAELLLAKELGVDCVIGHHPIGDTTKTKFTDVMQNQINRMVAAGVPINKAQKALEPKIDEVSITLHPTNYDQATSAARLLKIPYIGIHSPCDIIAERTVQMHMDKIYNKNPKAKIKDLIDELMTIPEYKNSLSQPIVRVGTPEDYCGRPFVIMAGGTGGGAEVFKAYFDAGVGTLVNMHIPVGDIAKVKEQGIGNVLVAGHMSSDSIGINGLMNELEKRGIEVIRMSGVLSPK